MNWRFVHANSNYPKARETAKLAIDGPKKLVVVWPFWSYHFLKRELRPI
jgi:hypothetical protein